MDQYQCKLLEVFELPQVPNSYKRKKSAAGYENEATHSQCGCNQRLERQFSGRSLIRFICARLALKSRCGATSRNLLFDAADVLSDATVVDAAVEVADVEVELVVAVARFVALAVVLPEDEAASTVVDELGSVALARMMAKPPCALRSPKGTQAPRTNRPDKR